MYSDTYLGRKEFTGMTITINNASAPHPTPPEIVQKMEEGTAIDKLMRGAVTPEEHTLLLLIDEMVDEAWRFPTGKALRGELRKMFTACGFSERRFYAAFRSIETRLT